MLNLQGFPVQEMPDLAQSRQLKAGFPWLTFEAALEAEFRRAQFDENVGHIRLNLGLAILVTLTFAALEALLLHAGISRLPSLIHLGLVAPLLAAALLSTFSPRRHRLYPPLALCAALLLGLSGAAAHVVAVLDGVPLLFSGLILTGIFSYFMSGLRFYQAVAANAVVCVVYLAADRALHVPGAQFGYDAITLMAVNLFCTSVVYAHEKTSRLRFLEAGLLCEMVARDGLTGIQNRRMFDQHMQRLWQLALREGGRIAVLLVDIDCFKDYNDRYGHQAGDECLRAVATSLSQSVRGPLDVVARYGGEEFAVVLHASSCDSMAEVLARIQRSIAALNIPHEASRVATRLTVSIGAACVLPNASRRYDGVVQLADEALYSAKEQGRNRVVVMEAEYHALLTGRFVRRAVHRTG